MSTDNTHSNSSEFNSSDLDEDINPDYCVGFKEQPNSMIILTKTLKSIFNFFLEQF